MASLLESTLLKRYYADIESGRLLEDASQAYAVEQLALLSQAFPRKLFRKPPLGMYLWGGVGRGKTYLMDLFFETLETSKKYRVHFYAFMQEIHEQLKSLQGHKNPLRRVAKSFSKRFEVLCFDEFFVTDIADALILGNLLEALFSEGLVLVTTSNIPPDDLYQNGIQRERFLPAIALLKKFTRLIHVDAGVDYRSQLTHGDLRYQQEGPQTLEWLTQYFKKLSGGRSPIPQEIMIRHRPLQTRGVAGAMIWLDFQSLCQTARCQYDYLEIVSQYTTILFSNIPVLSSEQDDAARRLIAWIDIVYDHQVHFVLTTQLPLEQLDQLYQGSRLAFEFERVYSRLGEMV